MSLFRGILQELVGLFVDDGMLALAIVAVIALAAVVVHLVHDGTGGIVLVAGALFVLFANLMAAQKD